MKKRKLPKFKSEDEEVEFWDKNSPLDFEEFERVELSLPKLKLSTKSITVRVPEALVNDIKLAANKRDVTYQSLMKVWLREKVESELYS